MARVLGMSALVRMSDSAETPSEERRVDYGNGISKPTVVLSDFSCPLLNE
jgi:hypothetical protein